MPGSLLAVWGFGSAAMLAWGAAALIPLAIHLWSRRRYREYSFAAMQFLIAAMKKQARRIQLEQWLLLAVRMLMLGLLAAALANPFWSRSASRQANVLGPTHWILVVDTSYSMTLRDGDRTLLQRLHEQFRESIEQPQQGDGFTIVRMENPPRVVNAEVLFDREEASRRVEGIDSSHGGADLLETLTLVERHLEQTDDRYPQFLQRRILIGSDLTRPTWAAVTSTQVREVIERIAAIADLHLLDVGLESAANLAITSCHSSHTTAIPGDRVAISAEVRAFGTKQPVDARLDFFHDGRVVHNQTISLTPGQAKQVQFEHRVTSAADQIISARLSADELELDNERWIAIRIQKALRVLCVGGEPDAAKFVALALNPDPGNDGPFDVEIGDERRLLDGDLSEFSCVFLCNVARLTVDESVAIRNYLAGGGALVVSVGDQVQSDAYNQVFGEPGIMPAKLGELKQGEWFFDPLEYRHPLVAPFRGRQRSGLLTVPTWRYIQLTPSTGANVALSFTSGDPAVVEAGFGRGRVVLVGSALSTSSTDSNTQPPTPWTALPAWPSFPPLIHQLVRIAIAGSVSERNLTVGDPLVVHLRRPEREVSVVTPSQQRRSLTAQATDDGGASAVFTETYARGVYQAQIGTSQSTQQFYAVNLNTVESDIRRIETDRLPAAFSAEASIGAARTTSPAGQPISFFRPLLVACAVLLIVEQALAARFGRRSS